MKITVVGSQRVNQILRSDLVRQSTNTGSFTLESFTSFQFNCLTSFVQSSLKVFSEIVSRHLKYFVKLILASNTSESF